MGPVSLGGSEERRGVHILGTPHWGSPVWTEGEPLSLWQRTWQPACGSRTVRAADGVLSPALPTQPERVSTSRVSTTADKGWVLERGLWRADPGRGLRLATRRHPEGMGGREELCKWDACGGSLHRQGTEHHC